MHPAERSMSAVYDSSAIEVLTGLDPVRSAAGMYTDTNRPNHLAQEVIDNSVDEAVAGHCHRIGGAVQGRLACRHRQRPRHAGGRPQGRGRRGVEVILTRLHAGGKFFEQELHLFRWPARRGRVGGERAFDAPRSQVRRGGKEYMMAFADRKYPNCALGKVDRKDTGSSVHFWPDV